MFFVIDRPHLQRIISIVRDDRTPSRQGTNAPFLRFAAIEDELTVSGDDVDATIPATVWEQGVLFIRPTVFRRLLSTFKGDKHFAIQVTETELHMGNVSLTYNPDKMRLFVDPTKAPNHWPLTAAEAAEWPIRSEYGWAIDIILKNFNIGLERICNERFLARRYADFQDKQDPIYHDLLNGMEDEALAKTFVSYWTIAQTMATQSRFWLETAVAEILIHKYRRVKNAKQYFVLNQGLLSEGYLKEPVSVAEMGDEHVEHLSSHRVWRVIIDAHALETIDVVVGQQERERVDERRPFQRRTWTDEQNEHARTLDQEHLGTVAESFKGEATSEVIAAHFA